MRRTTILILIALFLVPSFAEAGWELDVNHTGVHFKVRHMMVSSVRGIFEKIGGTVEYNERDASNTKIDVSIDAASVNTGIAKRDEHLRSPDFLGVEKFPTIGFRSKSVKWSGKGRYTIEGDLTLHGVTRPVTLMLEGPSKPAKGIDGDMHVGASATTRISRKDFGLTWNKALETGGVLVGDEVEITVEVELIKKGL